MKKSLIALAALSAVAGAAQAQSSVEVYGIFDMSYSQLKSTGSGVDSSGVAHEYKLNSTGNTNSGNGTGTLNGSRLGFRGTEDLGGGMKARFVAEYGINLTSAEDASTADSTKGQAMANLRQGYVALDTKAGTVLAGTTYSFVDATSGSLAGAQAHGGTNNSQGAASLLKYGQYARAANAIAYVSPTFAGVTVKLGTQQAENTRDNGSIKTNGATMWALDYANGPIKAGYAYEKIKNATFATGASAAAPKYAFTPMLGTVNDNEIAVGAGNAKTVLADLTYNVFGAQYDFGFATLGLNEARMKTSFNGNGTATSVTYDNFKSRQDSVSLSVPVKGTSLTLGAAYTDGKLELDGARQFDTKGVDLLAVYTLSKRTNVYAIYSQSKFDVTANAETGLANSKQTQTGLGIRHSF